MLFVLLWLGGCESAPTVLTEVDLQEVPVPVREPLPDDCFEQHSVNEISRMPVEGSLTIKEYVTWVDDLVVVTQEYQVQVTRCDGLNRADPTAPSEEP